MGNGRGRGPGGDEALAAIRRRPLSAAFDVIVVDATMPGMDGNTLANAIRSDPSLAKTPLIMMGAAKKAETSPPVRKTMEHWLTKPVRPSYLRATLLSLLASQVSALQKADRALAPPPSSASAAPPLGVALSPPRILVVDDNLVNCKVARKATREAWVSRRHRRRRHACAGGNVQCGLYGRAARL